MRRVQLVAPTSTDERIRYAGEQTDGWLYLVTLTGTTGARGELSPALAGLVERARRLVDVPLYAGFGITTPEHARAAADLADGIAVGSRAVEVAEEGPDALREYVASLRAALDAAASSCRTEESGGMAGAGSTSRGTLGIDERRRRRERDVWRLGRRRLPRSRAEPAAARAAQRVMSGGAGSASRKRAPGAGAGAETGAGATSGGAAGAAG